MHDAEPEPWLVERKRELAGEVNTPYAAGTLGGTIMTSGKQSQVLVPSEIKNIHRINARVHA